MQRTPLVQIFALLLLLFSLIYPPLTTKAIPMQPGFGPTPMGIGTLSSIKTTQWLGIAHIVSINASSFSIQLNVILTFKAREISYALFVQDTAVFESGGILVGDNIWAFAGSNFPGLSGNGYISYAGGQPFYGYGTWGPLSIPITIYLLVNVTTNKLGEPVIYFWYNGGHRWINFDTVTVHVPNATNVYFISSPYVSPFYLNSLYYEAELVLVGPGYGENVNIENGTLVYLQLFYWNGHNFQEVKSAVNFGWNTAETTTNAHVTPYVNQSNGELEAVLTAGREIILPLWNSSTVAQITIHAPVNEGYIYVYNANLPYSQGLKVAYKVPFVGGEAILTLYPMDYAILVYAKNGSLVGEAHVNVGAGQNVSINVTKFSVSLANANGITYVIIHAYGNVTINFLSPFKETLTTYVNGTKIIELNEAGKIVVNVSLFPGFYIVKQLTVPAEITFLINGPPSADVTFIFPNGTTKTLAIHNGEAIDVPAGTKYVLQQYINIGDIRWATPTQISGVINASDLIYAKYYEQRLIDFQYRVVNGKWNLTPPNVTYQYFSQLETVKLPAEVWVDYNSSFNLTNVTIGNERIILTKVVESQNSVIAYYTLQYYVNVNSPFPLEANNETLTSGWYNAGITFHIENTSYYLSKNVRYVITSISPSLTFTLNSPTNIGVNVTKQFLVVINGVKEWHNEGAKITLTANLPFYEIGVFIGTYNVPPNTVIVVNSPIEERLLILPNPILLAAIAIAIIILMKMKR